MSVIKSINYGPEAWKLLNGMFCVYKPVGISTRQTRTTLCLNLCRDLNQLERREIRNMVLLKGSVCTNKPFEVEVVPNYADHELVSGRRYQEQDIRMVHLYKLGFHCSGVMLFAVNDSCRLQRNLSYKNFLRQYEIKGKFGIATKNFISDGIVYERSTFDHVTRGVLDRVLASIQSTHQALAFKYSGIDSASQAGYEAAAKGLIKPPTMTDPLIYSIKCTQMIPPYFTLEVHCINETEEFLAELVHDIGIDVKSSAVCTQLRRTRFGPFTLSHALLRKHWTLEHILNNITLCRTILDQEPASDFQSIRRLRQTDVIGEMQKAVKEDLLA